MSPTWTGIWMPHTTGAASTISSWWHGWDPEAALRQMARELIQALHQQPGETVYLVIDDLKKAEQGTAMDAVARTRHTTTEAYMRGHQYVCAILLFRNDVIPWGIRLYVTQAHGAALELPFRKTTEVAA